MTDLDNRATQLGNILAELNRAKTKHPAWPTDTVHQAAILVEEAGEMLRAALLYEYEEGSFEDIRTECIQVAAMALRFLEVNEDKFK